MPKSTTSSSPTSAYKVGDRITFFPRGRGKNEHIEAEGEIVDKITEDREKEGSHKGKKQHMRASEEDPQYLIKNLDTQTTKWVKGGGIKE
ncbi:hypothetical protein BDY24DRAFT_443675 [Mrakia frigida]|uniref:DUF2945 domain-containing protein n=1 Tax=Mrakia frigida TaxID=29902 RepID=UPI003FCC07A8